MLTYLLFILTACLISIGSFFVATRLLCLPTGQARDAIRNLPGKKNFSEKLEDKLLLPLAHQISRLVLISDYKEKQLQSDLDRLEQPGPARLFVGLSITKALVLMLIGLFFIPLGMPWLSLLTTVAAVLAYFRMMQDLRKKVERVKREIAMELPRLVESLNYALKDNRDLLTFFEGYRKVSGSALGRELDKLILNMKIGNHTVALRSMDARLLIPQLSALVSILCGVHQGIDQRTSLLILEQDIRTIQREQLRREMEKRPGKIKIASFILTILMILMFMVPMILLIIKNLQSVGF